MSEHLVGLGKRYSLTRVKHLLGPVTGASAHQLSNIIRQTDALFVCRLAEHELERTNVSEPGEGFMGSFESELHCASLISACPQQRLTDVNDTERQQWVLVPMGVQAPISL